MRGKKPASLSVWDPWDTEYGDSCLAMWNRVPKRAPSLIFLEDSPTASGMRAIRWSLPLQMASTPMVKQTIERECPWLVAAKVHWDLFAQGSVSQPHGHLMVPSPSTRLFCDNIKPQGTSWLGNHLFSWAPFSSSCPRH